MSTKQTRPLMTRIPPEMVPRIDAQRGDVPRERWIRRLLEEALEVLERQADWREEACARADAMLAADTDRTLSA